MKKSEKVIIPFIVTFLGAVLPSTVFAQSDENKPASANAVITDDVSEVCNKDDDSAAKTDIIRAKYKRIIDDQTESIKSDAKRIQDEAPKPDKGEAIIGATFHFRDERIDFTIDVPQVTMRDQEMSMDVPEVNLVNKEFSWTVPEVKTRQSCRAGPDTIKVEMKTCHNDFPSFDYSCPETRTVRGPDICVDELVVGSRLEKVALGVPDIRMVTRKWKMGIPETKMVTETMSFTYPALVVDKIEAKSEKIKEETRNLNDRATIAMNAIQASMKKEIDSVTLHRVTSMFACQRDAMKAAFNKALATMSAYERTLIASLDTAKQINAPADVISQYEGSLASFRASKEKTIQDYLANVRDLNAKRKSAIASVISGKGAVASK